MTIYSVKQKSKRSKFSYLCFLAWHEVFVCCHPLSNLHSSLQYFNLTCVVSVSEKWLVHCCQDLDNDGNLKIPHSSNPIYILNLKKQMFIFKEAFKKKSLSFVKPPLTPPLWWQIITYFFHVLGGLIKTVSGKS